jgi:hypothetical protein
MQFATVVGLLQMPLLFPVISLPNVQSWAPVAGLAMCGITLTFYVTSYRRMMRLALEGTGVSSAKRPTLQGLVPLAARMTTLSPAARAICAFTLRTVIRSRQHRMLLAGWLGLAFAIAASGTVPMFLNDGWSAFDQPRTGILAVPLVFTALILVGMRMVFAIPSEIRANWTLKSRPPIPVRDALNGAAAALAAAAILPVLFAWLSATGLWGMRIGLIHSAFCATLGLLLAQLLAIGLDKVPFTCTYVPGKARFVKLWPLYLTAFSFYTYTMAGLEAVFLERGGILRALAILLLLAGAATYFRARRASEVETLRFEEEPSDTLTVLGVQS